jgi:bifunctional DNA-binding transcriptional regulator/antitoxin component of YhaV-PrlF toxin-antitoxin module
MKRIKICPKEWSLVKIITKNNEVYYRKNRKLSQYSYGINIPPQINSDFKIEKMDSQKLPLKFTTKIVKETVSYAYIIIPKEITEFLNFRKESILKIKVNEHIFFGKLRKKCKSLGLTIPQDISNKITKNYCDISIEKEILLDNPLKDILIVDKDNKLYFDLISIIPKKTSRDSNEFRILKIEGDRILVCCDFKHVKGINFKYVILPRYMDANKIALFFGLMHSDGLKKFGYREVYNKYIFSPILGFTNGDPHVINLFLNLFEELFAINRENFSINIKYPLEIDTKKEEYIKKFWQRITRCSPVVYNDKKRLNRWCPLGIVNAGIYEILLAEIIISSLKKFLFWLKNSDNKSLKTNFINGVLIGDGSPILDKGTLRRVMIAIEFRFEGEIYREILSSLGFKSRNLWPPNYDNLPPPYLRKLDIQGDTKFLELLLKKFYFGYFEKGKFYGSLEKQYRFIKGALKLRKLNDRQKLEIESSVLKTHLKSYINEVKSFLSIPKFYEEMINER